tara:strand:+ start:190 stop:318 length:129 start_codon:yes stop_codon:yes gene_type:complete
MLKSKPSKSNFDGFFMALLQWNKSAAFRAGCKLRIWVRVPFA